MWKLRVYLSSTNFVDLGDIRTKKPGWAEFSPPGIYRVELPFEGTSPDTKEKIRTRLIISGMMRFNFFVEATKNLLTGKVEIKKVWILGQTPDSRRVIGYTIGKKVEPISTIYGLEYNGFSTVGWKPGIIHDSPIATIVRE